MSFYDVLELKTSNNKNFIIKDKNAYTEDNVLVFTIFVYNIPKKFSEDDVLRYFTIFGKVSKVRLVDDKKKTRRSGPKVGFVTFAEPCGAYSALKQNTHRLQGSRIGVKAGDSWNQPDAEKACNQEHNDTEIASTSKESEPTKNSVSATADSCGVADIATSNSVLNVLSLNDDCLEIICRFLGLRDQVRFARVCQRFNDVFKMFCKSQCKNLHLYKLSSMTLWEVRDLFRLAGQHIEKMSGNIHYKNRERIIEFIRLYCVNLKGISFDDCKIRPGCMKKLLRSVSQLQELKLHDCSLSDNSIQALQYLKNLESLVLSENYEITGKFISKLVQLKSLNLYGCSNIQTSNMVDICKAMPNLKMLDIRRCERLSASFFYNIADHCLQLEILKMSCPDVPYERVALLPSIKQLELLHFSSGLVSNARLFAELVAHKADQLETLKIVTKNSLTAEHINHIAELKKLKTLFCANNQAVNDDALRKFSKLEQLEDLVIKGCFDITNDGLLKLLRGCRHLRNLNIQFCKKITYEFISKAIPILRDRSVNPKTPLAIMAYGTSIRMSPCEQYEQEESLIKLLYQTINIDEGSDYGVDLYDFWDDDWLVEDDEDDYDPTDEDDDFYFPDSEMDDDDINFAYNVFGQIHPHGFDLNDVIW